MDYTFGVKMIKNQAPKSFTFTLFNHIPSIFCPHRINTRKKNTIKLVEKVMLAEFNHFIGIRSEMHDSHIELACVTIWHGDDMAMSILLIHDIRTHIHSICSCSTSRDTVVIKTTAQNNQLIGASFRLHQKPITYIYSFRSTNDVYVQSRLTA